MQRLPQIPLSEGISSLGISEASPLVETYSRMSDAAVYMITTRMAATVEVRKGSSKSFTRYTFCRFEGQEASAHSQILLHILLPTCVFNGRSHVGQWTIFYPRESGDLTQEDPLGYLLQAAVQVCRGPSMQRYL